MDGLDQSRPDQALEALVYAIADARPDRAALRSAFDTYAAGSEAKMNGLPMGDRYIELLRASLEDLRAVINQGRFRSTVSR